MTILKEILLPLVVVLLNVWLAASTGLAMFYLMAAVIAVLLIARLFRPKA